LIIIVALSISVYPCNAAAEWASLLATEVCASGKKQEESIDLRTPENYRVNYLCYLDAKGESCKEEKLQKSRKETPFMESMRIAAGKQQGRD